MKHELEQISGIGKNMARHLINAGYPSIASLKGADPDEIWVKDCLYEGRQTDRCCLYAYRLAVFYANNDGILPADKQSWWDWSDK